jgi:hypothetical protein
MNCADMQMILTYARRLVCISNGLQIRSIQSVVWHTACQGAWQSLAAPQR